MATQFYLVLAGATKQSAALLMPVGSYQFLYNHERNEHILDGEALTLERFNEVAADIARRMPRDTLYRVVPVAVPGDEPEPANWQQERAELLRALDAKQALIAELQKPRRKPVPQAIHQPPLTTPLPEG